MKNRRHNLHLIFTLGLLLLVGCNSSFSKKNLPATYFSGRFAYMADAAVFEDCATGLRYAVSQKGNYLTVEQAYTSLEPAPHGELVPVRFHGHVDTTALPLGESTLPVMVIDTLIGFSLTSPCSLPEPLVGRYESQDHNIHQTLLLRPDHTFVLNRFPPGKNEELLTGNWGLAAEFELVLMPDLLTHTVQREVPRQLFFQLIPNPLTLTANSHQTVAGVFTKSNQ